jgi:hypothetical protein
VGLINDNMLERNLLEKLLKVLNENFIRSYKDVELDYLIVLSELPVLSNIASVPFLKPYKFSSNFAFFVIVANCVQEGPVFKSPFPVRKSRQRSEYKERSCHLFLVIKMVEKSHCLYSLSQTHFISQNNILFKLPRLNHPVQTL